MPLSLLTSPILPLYLSSSLPQISAAICEVLTAKLGVPANRVYIQVREAAPVR